MKPFLSETFLLHSDAARRLYFDFAASAPIYDYHSHLLPAELATDRQFDNLAQVWLDGDHYKWRAMRTAGIDEELITGDATEHERFIAFAGIVPQCIGNPVYHWTHMELRHPLGIDDVLLGPATAESIWQRTIDQLAEPALSARGMLRQFDVRMVATTDDPADSLADHAAIASDTSMDIKVLPSFRPDPLFKPTSRNFAAYLERLGAAADVEIRDYASLTEALRQRLDHFAAHGCVSADHGFDQFRFSNQTTDLDALLSKRLNSQSLSESELTAWISALATWLGEQYAERGWVMQLHIGAQRDNNSRMLERLGPNTGFDSIGDAVYAKPLAGFLDRLDQNGRLPRTILYCLNPRDNEMLATMAGNFQGGGVAGKIQFGSAWWFNDQQDGIWRQLVSVSQMGLLSRFIGMLTDSRSLTSFSRHEYFRRILCDLVGSWVESGQAPADFDLLGNMISDVTWRNTVSYFGLDDSAS